MTGSEILKREVETRPLEFLEKYFPNGVLTGDEYELGDVSGSPGKSLRYNIKKNTWSDFATDARGYGFLSLYAASLGGTVQKALQELEMAEGSGTVTKRPPKKKKPPKGLPAGIDGYEYWVYTTDKGLPLMYVKRVDKEDGKKDFFPYRWNGQKEVWEMKRVPGTLPLYNMPMLVKSQQVIVVEGEKAADALQDVVGEKAAVTTWPNGAQSVAKASWAVLKGKKVTLWPDNDQVGHKCMQALADLLPKFHVERIYMLTVDDLEPKSDAADCEFKTANAFFMWANERAVQISEAVVAPSTKKSKRVTEDTLEEAGTDIDTMGEALYPASTIANVKGLTRSHNGGLHANYNNVFRTIEQDYKGLFWWDEFHQVAMTTMREDSPVPLTNEKMSHLLGILQGNGYPRLGLPVVEMAVKAYVKSSRTPKRNLKAEDMRQLVWDKTPRLKDFLHIYMGAPKNQYTEAVSQNFLVSIVARTVKPGTKVDNMLVLEGRQGISKGKALEALVGAEFYSEESGRFDEELVSRMIGKQIMEYSELASVTNRNFEFFKSFLTRRRDRVRRKWSKDAEDINRTAVWVGTTNKETYIHDNTGGRRFWPVTVDEIDYKAIARDRDQLFAEAYELYDKGATWWEVPDQAEQEQYKRRASDPWETTLREALQGERARGIMETDVKRICVRFLGFENREVSERVGQRVEGILRLLGYRRQTDNIGNIYYIFAKEY